MLDVNVKIKGLNVLNFNPKDRTVEFEILFDKYKTVKTMVLENPAQIAYGLVQEIRRKIKQKNTRFNDDVLEDNVNVMIANEEDAIQKIYSFLNKVSDRVNAVKNTTTATNYLDMVNKVKNLKLEF
jgi:hypothetical protein